MRFSFLDNTAIRVATIAAAAVAAALIVAATVTDIAVQQSAVGGIDQRLAERIGVVTGIPRGQPLPYLPGQIQDAEQHAFDVPLEAWFMNSAGDIVATTPFTPDLPSDLRNVTGPTDAQIAGVNFRVMGATSPAGGWVVIGQSRASIDGGFGRMLLVEALVLLALTVLVFFGALVVGRQVARPIEAARQRQLAFTADASHELRTPVAVIAAETSLALSRTRKVSEYKDALNRVNDETGRLSRMVDSLLWLARFDATPKLPDFESADLSATASAAVERFSTVAATKKIAVAFNKSGGSPETIRAPREWVERLLGVLIDNACRYTPEGGRVLVGVSASGEDVTLAVEDSGPGIPLEEREQIFQRFHRAVGASKGVEGAGLGLAIADAVVKSTQGRWEVGESSLGGARLAVSWTKQSNVKQQTDQNQQQL